MILGNGGKPPCLWLVYLPYYTVLYYTFFIILFLPSLKSLLAMNVHIKLAVASHT